MIRCKSLNVKCHQVDKCYNIFKNFSKKKTLVLLSKDHDKKNELQNGLDTKSTEDNLIK